MMYRALSGHYDVLIEGYVRCVSMSGLVYLRFYIETKHFC